MIERVYWILGSRFTKQYNSLREVMLAIDQSLKLSDAYNEKIIFENGTVWDDTKILSEYMDFVF